MNVMGTSTRETDRVDQGRTPAEWLRPREFRIESDLYTPIEALRCEDLTRVLARLQATGPSPRVCLYAISVDRKAPRVSLRSAEKYERRSFSAVSREQTFTDPDEATAPNGRQGWSSVRELIRAGLADGGVVLMAGVVSGEIDQCRNERARFEEQIGFDALVVPEITGAQS
ncbi:hypothetical protein [Streptomyces sp. NBC_00102]|uniref:hypothetical protein n=1 Tax=Streptomyces sp. NBC_00102 TaxID=2975652 RepID=UPI00224F5F84|nr:hypothetical protein [Streptomyces sp. NBC_00102]MCX5397202.1 hypothetical protein [Streptomyces sp. NBC_00102]